MEQHGIPESEDRRADDEDDPELCGTESSVGDPEDVIHVRNDVGVNVHHEIADGVIVISFSMLSAIMSR
jgi:hypothetical protein